MLSGHLAFRMEGVRGKHSPIAVGVRITSDDSSEENLTRFIQQDEVHVLTPVMVTMRLCVYPALECLNSRTCPASNTLTNWCTHSV